MLQGTQHSTAHSRLRWRQADRHPPAVSQLDQDALWWRCSHQQQQQQQCVCHCTTFTSNTPCPLPSLHLPNPTSLPPPPFSLPLSCQHTHTHYNNTNSWTPTPSLAKTPMSSPLSLVVRRPWSSSATRATAACLCWGLTARSGRTTSHWAACMTSTCMTAWSWGWSTTRPSRRSRGRAQHKWATR